MTTHIVTSPLGLVCISGTEAGVSAISCTRLPTDQPPAQALPAPVRQAADQLAEYFAGQRTTFDFPMTPAGTPFQQRVWEALLTVPFGQTESYGQLSKRLGDIQAIRAVAAANGKNPLWIVVPCHRIIGADGSLTGYAGGLWRKQWLLAHEGALPDQQQGQLRLF